MGMIKVLGNVALGIAIYYTGKWIYTQIQLRISAKRKGLRVKSLKYIPFTDWVVGTWEVEKKNVRNRKK